MSPPSQKVPRHRNFHPPKFPVHGSFRGLTALPPKSYLAVGFCHLKFAEDLSEGEQDTLESSLPPVEGESF